MLQLIATHEDTGQRIDQWLAPRIQTSRSQVQDYLRRGLITVNGSVARASHALKLGDLVTYNEEVIVHAEESAQTIDLPILYIDDDVVVINKPAGISAHPSGGTRVATVTDFARPLTTDTDDERPGIVHRLDRETSGVMILARTPESKLWLQKQFHDRLAQKRYLALAIGRVRPEEAIIRLPLARSSADPLRRVPTAHGKEAETAYKVLEELPGYSFIEGRPKTGRTHQIRAHFTAVGHPLAGDIRYGAPAGPPGLTRHFLHASSLTITLPSGRIETFTAPLPPELEAVLNRLRQSV
jgi:23S rRNA pseudouridine1911/1915/1917 synthase